MSDLYAVTYNTESGDEGFAGLFDYKPTDNDLKAFGEENYPEEHEDGDCTIYFKVHKAGAIKSK